MPFRPTPALGQALLKITCSNEMLTYQSACTEFLDDKIALRGAMPTGTGLGGLVLMPA